MRTLLCATAVLLVSLAIGCGQGTKQPADKGHDHDHDHASTEKGGHTHGAWWCDEHGVPEEVCALCNSKVAAEFQKKGDWCKEHDRPDTQCFICHPELEAKFASQYEAKYGKKPPKAQ